MASRYIRNTAILAKIETTYGTDPTPTGGSNAMLVTDLSINPLNAAQVDRDLVRPYFGASEQLVATYNAQCSFSVELAGSGAAGTAPPYGPLLRACGLAETLTAVTRAEYAPVSTAFESVTIYWYDDGVLHKLTGARGTFELDLSLGSRPSVKFTFTGLYNAITATALPSTTLTGFQKPLVVNDTNTGDVTLAGTYTTGTYAGGTSYPSRGVTLSLGNSVNHVPLLGGESVDITDRDTTGSIELDLTAAQEVTLSATVLANTTQTVGITHGTAAGNIFVLSGAAAQLADYAKSDLSGKRLVRYGVRFVPVSGNDEFKLCFR